MNDKPNKKVKRLSLLNYEGDVLWMLPSDKPGIFVVYDQESCIVDFYSVSQLCDWMDGKFDMLDIAGRKWNYPESHTDAKVSIKRFVSYILNTNR